MKQRSTLFYDGLMVNKTTCDKGEGIPLHHHVDYKFSHITICLKGSVRCHGPSFDYVLDAGQVTDFSKAEQEHALTAMEDGTVFLNIRAMDWEEDGSYAYHSAAGLDLTALAGMFGSDAAVIHG